MNPLTTARRHAQSGRFPELLALCRDVVERDGASAEQLLETGALLQEFGFLARARECFERVCALVPDDARALANLANLARELGAHAECRRLYGVLMERLPNHRAIRRNALLSLEYDPAAGDAERRDQAAAWGAWATIQAGGPHPRPALRPLSGRALRVGYVSADFCQHTVGLFAKDVLAAHDPARVEVFAYSAGRVRDWVTEALAAACHLRDVGAMDDAALAALISADRIDVLVDLSGHTAGSRLSAFALRPAPVQVSWLGYFATTGLSCIDAVLLDRWHAPPGMETQFVEPVVRLPMGRLCYRPVPWAPAEVAPPPCVARGYMTFGCFNNSAKLNDAVFDAWARILAAVPESRLVLKWRSFNDDELRLSVGAAFARRGIETRRIELRGPSFHAELLNEYADIDVALDPFPFSGGLTSCEALWMGVPLVTWPTGRVVSRQGFALVSAIGLAELAARDADDYVRIAADLAADRDRLVQLRAGMRARMRDSALMDARGFAAQIEQCLRDLYHDIYLKNQEPAMTSKTILHVGPGHRENGAKLPPVFHTPEWREIRLDIDPGNEPDIVGSMLDMAAVPSESVDAVYSAHNIEHVYAHEVPTVLGEFLRVLKPEGFLVVTCPDLQSVCALVAQDRLADTAYQSSAGPITPLDILYGHGPALAAGYHYMAHKCGFTLKTLQAALQGAGFKTIAGARRPAALDLWLVATKTPWTEADILALAGRVLPT